MMIELLRPSDTIVLEPRSTLDNEVPCSGLKMTLWDKKSLRDRKACGVVGIESITEKQGPQGREFQVVSDEVGQAFKDVVGVGVVGDRRINPWPVEFTQGPVDLNAETSLNIRFYGKAAQ